MAGRVLGSGLTPLIGCSSTATTHSCQEEQHSGLNLKLGCIQHGAADTSVFTTHGALKERGDVKKKISKSSSPPVPA